MYVAHGKVITSSNLFQPLGSRVREVVTDFRPRKRPPFGLKEFRRILNRAVLSVHTRLRTAYRDMRSEGIGIRSAAGAGLLRRIHEAT